MNLKNNKGYVATDAAIAVLILLIIIPTIAGMMYNVNKTNNLIDRKTEAINIAINTIETAKGIDVAQLNEQKVAEQIKTELYKNIDTTDISALILEKNDSTYRIIVDIKDYIEIDNTAISNKVKIVDVTVEYRIGKQTENIKLSTVIS